MDGLPENFRASLEACIKVDNFIALRMVNAFVLSDDPGRHAWLQTNRTWLGDDILEKPNKDLLHANSVLTPNRPRINECVGFCYLIVVTNRGGKA